MRREWRRPLCAAFVVWSLAACGKKGPPLAPLLRIPAQVGDFAVARAADEVFLTLTVPTTNVGRDTPADVGHVEVVAVTAERAPDLPEGELPAPWTTVVRAPVRRPAPSAPPKPEVPPLPLEPGLDQGQRATFRDVLTPDRREPVATTPLPEAGIAAPPDGGGTVTGPLVAPARDRTAQRFYAARAVSRSGRPGAWSPVRAVPVADTLAAPVPSTPTYDASSLSLTWTAPPGAVSPPPAPAEGLLPSRPFGPAATPTRYNVYAAAAAAATPGPLDTVTRSAPLNAAPLDERAFTATGVVFGQERCFVVRAIDSIGGVAVEGPPSPPACVTPRDTFPPPAPAALEAVGGAGVISLIWDAVEADDLAGYLVFRGEGDGAAETPLTPAPIRDTSFEDRGVTPGVRYAYVVVAVDSASPGNRSAPSNRAEETAR
jgi:hypothetical protein